MTVVLVTGGSGLVGRAVAAEVQDAAGETWVFCCSRDADLRDRAQTFALWERVRPTHVLHLAAKVGGLFMNMRCPVEMFNDNIAINTNVMEACREHKVKKLVTTLSMCIFPDKVTYPIDETMLHDGPPSNGLVGYAQSKRMAEVLSRCYNKQYGTLYTTLIPTNVFGPHDNYNLEDAHVLPALIHKAYLAKRDGTPLTIMGTGTPLRQFIYSPDMAKVAAWAVRSYESEEPLIVSVREEVSIKEAALLVARAVGFEGDVVFDTTKADGQLRKTASIDRLAAALPGVAFTPFAEAIEKSAQWFVENYADARK